MHSYIRGGKKAFPIAGTYNVYNLRSGVGAVNIVANGSRKVCKGNSETVISWNNIKMLLRTKCLGVVTRTILNLTEQGIDDMKRNVRLHPCKKR